MGKLPIDEIKERFNSKLEVLPQSGILVVTAPTGSGKSTRLPLWCATQGKRVLVIEPRRVAARTIAGWVAKSRAERVGGSVGYCVRFDSKYTDSSQIVFVTPGIARRWLLEGISQSFDVVIFDEFHERSWETDVLFAIWAARTDGPRLVVTSATLTATRLVEQFGASLIETHGRSFPVDIQYLKDSDRELTVPSARNMKDRVVRAVRSLWQQLGEGSMLVFLPGLAAMRDIASRLQDLPVVLLHGGFSQSEQALAFSSEERKIVLATNVAESSLTLPGIVAVVDSGLERRQIHQSGYVALATVAIALSSADQRAGRAGRVCPGMCLRLWSPEARLEESRPPDLCRMELDEMLLFLSALPGGLKACLNWVDEPPTFAWERAANRLKAAGLVAGDGRITDWGGKVQSLPVDLAWASVLVSAPLDFRGPLCDLAALASARRNPMRATKSEEDLERRKADLGQDPWGQALSILNVGRPGDHALDQESLKLCQQISDDLRRSCGAGLRPKVAVKASRELRLYLAKSMTERFFVLRDSRQAWANGKVECRLARGEELPANCEAAFFLQVEPVLGRGLKVELQGRWPLPVRLSLLGEAELGELELSKLRWVGNTLQARVVRKHAGRDLSSKDEELKGAALRKALGTLAEHGRWRKDLVELLDEERFYQTLQAELDCVNLETVPASVKLETQLELLGVESVEDLELLSDSDFLTWNPEPHCLEKLKADYPMVYRIGGLSFNMIYEPQKKRVVLNSRSQAKGAKIPLQLLPRWNGWAVFLNEKGRLTNLRTC